MATRKAAGSAKNLTDSKPKYLGTKLYAGETAVAGNIIVRQRGSKIAAGKNVKMGRDHTLYAVANGKVSFTEKRMKHFDGTIKRKKLANVD
ncbi:MAG: 50S ribosomal protein L27 [Candidatus Pacebacteria bacterium]|jgi:large subunit ribosomal protein L27|nr:50S ribosomal protein L27 [Candidatus Paceibacterota bacterium]